MDSWRQAWIEEEKQKRERLLQRQRPPPSVPAPRRPPKPAYNTPPIDTALYTRIAQTTSRVPLQTITIPPRSGHAFHVPATCIFRLSTPEGAQVGDLNIWNAQNARERFWAARTRQLQRSHVSVGDRLWSCLPYLRPMCTIVADTLERFADSEEGKTEWGGRCHDLLGTRCDPYVNALLTDTDYDYHCHSNLTRAILPHGLAESDVHDVLNVFQVTGLNDKGQYFMEPSPATSHDYIEFFAEQDLLCALSTCPGGDLSAWAWEEEEGQGEGEVGAEGETGKDERDGGKKGMLETCRPIKVEVWRIEEEAREEVLRGWKEPKRPVYRGMHGMVVPEGEARKKGL